MTNMKMDRIIDIMNSICRYIVYNILVPVFSTILYYSPKLKLVIIKILTFNIPLLNNDCYLDCDGDKLLIYSSDKGNRAIRLFNVFYKYYSPWSNDVFASLSQQYLESSSYPIRYKGLRYSNEYSTTIIPFDLSFEKIGDLPNNYCFKLSGKALPSILGNVDFPRDIRLEEKKNN
jgi:hypothetical protein